MASHKRIGVLQEGSGDVIYYVKPRQAFAIMAEGFADVLDDRTIRIRKNSGLVMARSSDSLANGGQGSVYESAATDKHPRFFAGGLCRTETRPGKIDRFSGARVGHQ